MNFTLLQTRYRTRLLFLMMLPIFLILIVPNSAFANSNGPSITDLFPADGGETRSGTLTIKAKVMDPDFVRYNSILLAVNGTLVTPIKQYGWEEDYSEDYTTLYVYYHSQFIEGVHTVSLTASDMLGNAKATNWQFTVGQPPVINPIQPKRDATVNEARPLISASITDNTAVDAASVEMFLNGQKVYATFDSGAGIVNFTPTSDLANERWHTVVVKAKDIAGASSESSWRFFANSYGDMNFTLNDATCQQCHDRQAHPVNNCGLCHGINTTSKPAFPLDDCYGCHFNTTRYPAMYHQNGLPFVDPPTRHTAQETDSCVECHTKQWSPTIPVLHNSVVVADRHITTSQGCSTCHANTLTREHVQRYDDNGQQLTCFSCHNSPDPNVQQAIKDKDSSCNACHTGLDENGGHPQHQNSLDNACQTCHSNDILTEQQFHKNNGCGVCHNTQANETVKYAIMTKNTECTACHTQGHNLNMVSKEPQDLPKYPGFMWTLPEQAAIMAGEPWVPQEFTTVGGKMLISSRRMDLTASDLFNWYREQMSVAGWEKIGGAEAPSRYMVLSFTKGDRLATVIIYNGEYHSADAPEIGYRVEIFYK